jgi:hypothetical protein
MALISIVSKIFFEGREPGRESREPALSFFRRCVFAGLSVLIFYPDFFGHLWLQILFGMWAVVFVFFCDGGVMEYVDSDQGREKPALDKKIISVLKAPFSFFFVNMLNRFKKHRDIINKYLKCCSFLQESLYGFAVLFFSLAYVFILPGLILLALLKFTVVDFLLFFVILKYNRESIEEVMAIIIFFVVNKKKELLIKSLKFVCRSSIRLLTFANIVFFTGMILIFALSLIVGLTLNGEYFGPFLAPIFTLIVYFWKNWKLSVEAKCLQLKTSIIEVCKEKIPATEDEQKSGNNGTNVNGQNNSVQNEKVPLQKDGAVGTNVYGQNNPDTTEQVQEDEQNPENRRGRTNARIEDITNPQTTRNEVNETIELQDFEPSGQINRGFDGGDYGEAVMGKDGKIDNKLIFKFD